MGEINKTKFEKNDDGIVIHDVSCSKYPRKKYKINLMNRILKDLIELQEIYFDDDNKFHFITDIISKYSFLVYEEETNNVKN